MVDSISELLVLSHAFIAIGSKFIAMFVYGTWYNFQHRFQLLVSESVNSDWLTCLPAGSTWPFSAPCLIKSTLLR